MKWTGRVSVTEVDVTEVDWYGLTRPSTYVTSTSVTLALAVNFIDFLYITIVTTFGDKIILRDIYDYHIQSIFPLQVGHPVPLAGQTMSW